MRTKIFSGESLPAVLHQVRQEFGENAIIINTRECGSHRIEIEVGWWVQGESAEQLFHEEEPTLGILADLSQDTDVKAAMTAQGVCAELRDFCVDNLPKKGEECERLAHALSRAILIDGSIPFHSRCVLLLGPSQAGKTTTMLKLAARLREALGCKVGIVSAEAGRDANEERISGYADLLDLPIEIADERLKAADRIPKAVSRLEECDLILIDTPSAGLHNEREHLHLTRLLQPCRDMEKLLVLPSSQDSVSMRLLLQRFESYRCSRIILTKLDQCGRLGPALNALSECELPLGFFGLGDRVPQDIEPASARKLAALLLRRMH